MFNIVSVVFATILITMGSFEIYNYKKSLEENVKTYNKVKNIKFLQNIINNNILNYTYIKPSNVMLENSDNLNIYTDIVFQNFLKYIKNNKKIPKSCQVLKTKYCKDFIDKEVYFIKLDQNGNLIKNSNINNDSLKLYKKLIDKDKSIYVKNIINKRKLVDTSLFNNDSYFDFITLK